MPRISRFETLTLLLLVEGKTFEVSDVEAVESKGTTGKVVQKEEQVSSPWQHLVILPIFLIVLLVPFSFGTWLGKEIQASAIDYLVGLFDPLTPSKQLAGYKVEAEELHPLIAGQLAKATFDGRISLRFSEILRRGDILHMTLIVANNTKQTLIVDVSAKSSASERGPLGFGESRVDDAFIGAGAERALRIKTFLPETSSPRVVVLEYRFNLGRDSSTLQQTITFN